MSVSIALVCEGPTDPPRVCALADCVIVAGVGWIDADEIATHRHYRGFRPTDPYMTWFEIDDLVREFRVPPVGHFDGLPLHGDGHNAVQVLTLLTLHAPEETPVEAIIFFRDGDREHDARRDAILRVRDRTPLPIPVVVGVANRMGECWVLNGFEPGDGDERVRLAAEHERVGFDPRLRAHDLSARGEAEDRSPKRVLRVLTEGDADRERACVWNNLDLLRERGEATGLREFIVELETRLVAAFR